ncbi:RNA ligase (ATP) protein [Trichomonas vaginalis G3]|nr:RNA ligase (ATP) protein [Trichomonas vaginalis G3]KAI5488468.1 RNA ligase (ATP) protein [Trichomonas vaginalis G3]
MSFDLQHLAIDPSLIKEIKPCVYEIPIGFVPNMKVPGYFYSTPEMAKYAFDELQNWMSNRNQGLPSILQISFVATLPGITKGSFGMLDMHSGYGFSIGGVAAFDTTDPDAFISPGGVGYDINCGVRLMTTNLTWEEVEPVKKELVEKLYEYIPVGVGGKLDGVCDRDHLRDVMLKGAGWALENGFAVQEDIDNCEENGCLKGADPSLISDRTIARGKGQLGTVGAGNHYIEVQRVDKILDEEKARVMDLHEGQVVVMIHTGSRGLGHQVADENMKVCSEKFVKESLPDKQLAAPSFHSEEGQKYLRAMYAAANFVWCNRQVIMHNVRRAFSDVFKDRKLETHLVYDVAHNIAKVEKHNIDGVEKEYIVHRKGATRAFGPGRQEISEKYRSIGQPILIGGSMGTASYVLVGTDESMKCAFGSTCHGAGRLMSRSKALKTIPLENVQNDLASHGVFLKAADKQTIQDESPDAYKDIEQVIDACETVGISHKVARLVPMGVIKG